ncbi:hypothetical protein ACOKW7_30130 [Limnospira platensis CENA597]
MINVNGDRIIFSIPFLAIAPTPATAWRTQATPSPERFLPPLQ